MSGIVRLLMWYLVLSLLCQPLAVAHTYAQSALPTGTSEPPQPPTATPQANNTADDDSLNAEQSAEEWIDQQIERLLQKMSPEDRVGQLFIIAFEGNDLSATSDIAALIHDYRIGGVMLLPSKENFSNAKGINTPEEIARLTNRLQALAYGYWLPAENALPDEALASSSEPTASLDIQAGTETTVENISSIVTAPVTVPVTTTSQPVTSTAELSAIISSTLPLSRTPLSIPPLSITIDEVDQLKLIDQLGLIALPTTGIDITQGAPATQTATSDIETPLSVTDTNLSVDRNRAVAPNRSLTATMPVTGADIAQPPQHAVNIPLLIGVEQLGDGYPATALRRNFTSIPSQLALGSTWNPTLVQDIGAIVGSELHAVGVNLLLGPSLDITNRPRTDPVGALGIYTYGGDPYWVGKMGSAYIAGVHEGSGFQLAAIARHFPGQGDIDRFPEQEVATIQQNLSELQQITLPPFRQVTRQNSIVITSTGAASSVDGLMTSHMRFSAFQGTNTTRIPPLSLMPDLSIILTQEGFADWHEKGGVLMSNALGVPAIRRYYEAPLQEFPYRRVALDAFVAGHDLLYLGQLSADNFWATENNYIREIVQFFRERYGSDPEFQVQVDQAVRRILRLKFGLYHPPSPTSATDQPTVTAPATAANLPIDTGRDSDSLAPLREILVTADDLAIFADNSDHRQQAAATIGQAAREALSILYPDLPIFSDLIPAAPQASDQLLIFSDSRLFHECPSCTAETTVGPEEIKSIITRLYGSDPGATGQIMPEKVFGRSFVELATLLASTSAETNGNGATTATPSTTVTPIANTTSQSATVPSDILGNPVVVSATPISGEERDSVADDLAEEGDPNARLQQLINESNWIIFAMLDVDPERNPASVVVKQFLRQQSERLGNKKIIVLALNAPYFLDSTEISKLTAYVGVYSKTQPFLESAVRVLFRTFTPTGSPAVSVPGTRFRDLTERLSPDPANDLQLTISLNGTPLEPSPDNNSVAPIVAVGSTLQLQVTRILDRNGHPVPDGIPVQFHLSYENPEMTIPLEPTLTRNGSATREIVVDQTGRLLITASAREATTSGPFTLRIQDPVAEATANAVATSAEEAKGTATAALIPLTTTVPTTTTVAVAEAGQVGGPQPLEAAVAPAEWATVDTLIIAMLTILVTLSMLLILQLHILPRGMLVHNMLWATICGLGAYILFALGLVPGTTFLLNTLRFWSAAVVVFIGMLLPLLWLRLRDE